MLRLIISLPIFITMAIYFFIEYMENVYGYQISIESFYYTFLLNLLLLISFYLGYFLSVRPKLINKDISRILLAILLLFALIYTIFFLFKNWNLLPVILLLINEKDSIGVHDRLDASGLISGWFTYSLITGIILTTISRVAYRNRMLQLIFAILSSLGGSKNLLVLNMLSLVDIRSKLKSIIISISILFFIIFVYSYFKGYDIYATLESGLRRFFILPSYIALLKYDILTNVMPSEQSRELYQLVWGDGGGAPSWYLLELITFNYKIGLPLAIFSSFIFGFILRSCVNVLDKHSYGILVIPIFIFFTSSGYIMLLKVVIIMLILYLSASARISHENFVRR